MKNLYSVYVNPLNRDYGLTLETIFVLRQVASTVSFQTFLFGLFFSLQKTKYNLRNQLTQDIIMVLNKYRYQNYKNIFSVMSKQYRYY